MGPGGYLLRLTERLAGAVARLAPETRARHADYLRNRQNPEGGFSGREGGSDLYYTGFALRGLAILDALEPALVGPAADFLRQSLTQQASVVDFYSLLYACLLVQAAGGPDVLAQSPPDWPERVAATLETFRTADGGYAKVAGHAAGSTYHTFLVGLCYELLGRSLPRSEEVVRFVLSRRREDGGFVEIAPMRRSGTNPTAAAVGLLQLLEQEGGISPLTPELRAGVVAFLAEMPSFEGGLRANGRAPLADLLSTFTATWTLDQLGALDRIDTSAALHFVQSVEIEEGGFHGGLWDEGVDVEYTFYGLGALGLLSDPSAR
jgi:geranylgeranyl transferase type-2 subunit beta